MTTYLYRLGDGNEGNYPRFFVELKSTDCPYAAIAAIVANRYIARSKTRRHIVRNIETDGEPEFSINATVYEGPNGETAFDAAWITAEFEPATESEISDSDMRVYRLRDMLDRAALAQFRKANRKGA